MVLFFSFFFPERESTLFVVLQVVNLTRYGHEVSEFLETAKGCLTEKLALIPTTKLMIEDRSLSLRDITIPQESLAIQLSWGKELAIILELLNKRWMTLDLLSILQEAQRTLPSIMTGSIPEISENELYGDDFQYPPHTFAIYENLSCLPRLHKDEQKSGQSDL